MNNQIIATGERFSVGPCGDYTDFATVVAWFAMPAWARVPERLT